MSKLKGYPISDHPDRKRIDFVHSVWYNGIVGNGIVVVSILATGFLWYVSWDRISSILATSSALMFAILATNRIKAFKFAEVKGLKGLRIEIWDKRVALIATSMLEYYLIIQILIVLRL